MVVKCEIQLNCSEDGCYRNGSVVSGNVIIKLSKSCHFEKIMIALKGRSDVWWKERNRNDAGSRSHFKAKDQIVDIDVNILNNEVGILPAGTFIREFSFTLPIDAPSTYSYQDSSSYYASISYCVRAKLFYASFFSFPMRYKKEIQVINMMQIQIPREPISYSLKENLVQKFGTISTNDDIDLKVIVSNTFVKPSDNAELCLQVTNNTKYSIHKLIISLYQVVTLRDDMGRTKVISKEIKESRQKTNKVGKNNYTCMYATVPIPSNSNTIRSRVISKDYKIVVAISIPHIKRENSLDIQLTVVGALADFDNEVATIASIATIATIASAPTMALNEGIGSIVNNNHVMENAECLPERPPTYWEAISEEK